MTSSSQSTWKFKYDETLQQSYYVNTIDNSISFDLPCEVKSKDSVSGASKFKSNLKRISSGSAKSCASSTASNKRPSLLTKIGSALSLKSNKSSSSSIKSVAPTEPVPADFESMDDSSSTLTDSKSIITGFDEILLQPAFNLDKYNSEDAESISSDDSIHSYYSGINQNDVYYDYSYDNYSLLQVPNNELQYNYADDDDYNKEKERLELRLQFQKELQI